MHCALYNSILCTSSMFGFQPACTFESSIIHAEANQPRNADNFNNNGHWCFLLKKTSQKKSLEQTRKKLSLFYILQLQNLQYIHGITVMKI